MNAEDIAEHFGYSSAADFIVDNMEHKDLMDMLKEYLSEDESLYEIAHELAQEQGYKEPVEEDEDEAYERWKDDQLFCEDDD